MGPILQQTHETDLGVGARSTAGSRPTEGLVILHGVGRIQGAAVQTDQPPLPIPGSFSADTELRKVTVDYTVEFARILRGSSPGAAFSFLSGGGADPTGGSRLAFALDKGEAEKTLLAAGFPHIYIFRPAYIYPVEPRKEPNLSYRLLRAIYPAFRVLFPNQMIPADQLGRAMVDAAVLGTVESEARILENRDIRAMVKS